MTGCAVFPFSQIFVEKKERRVTVKNEGNCGILKPRRASEPNRGCYGAPPPGRE